MSPAFANPLWLWCLLLLAPVAALRVWAHWRSRGGPQGLVSPRLTRELIVGARQWTRWAVYSLQLLALALLVMALARPQWGHEIIETESESRNVLIAIDTSRSMLGTDLIPDRLTRAKLAAQDILEALPEDRIGVIAFAGKPFLQAPLTLDHDAVIETIQQLDTEIIPRGGTNLAEAGLLAAEVFRKVGSGENALILFSDGEVTEGEERMAALAEEAKAIGLTVVAVGVGTESGSILPEPDERGRPQPGAFISDEEGNLVRSRLDPATLQAMARLGGGGVYLDLGATPRLAPAARDAIVHLEAARGMSGSRSRPVDRFVWPLWGALFLVATAWLLPGTSRLAERLIAAWRAARPASSPPLGAGARTAARLLAAGMLPFLSPPGAAARLGETDSAAFQAYLQQDYPAAIARYQDEIAATAPGQKRAWLNLGLGASAYRAGDLALAKEAFGRTLAEGNADLSSQAHYNLANALFRSGQDLLEQNAHPQVPVIAKDEASRDAIAAQWQAAMEHYRAALALGPSSEAARHNLSVVEERLGLLEQPPPEEEEPPPEEEKEEEEEEQQQDQPQDQDSQSSPQEGQPDPDSSADPQPGDPDNQPDQPDQPQDPSGEPGQPQPGDQPDSPPPPPEAEPEGELEGQPSPPGQQEGAQPPPRGSEVNPETGFSPDEARHMLRNLADEDEDVRPALRLPAQAENYKNW